MPFSAKKNSLNCKSPRPLGLGRYCGRKTDTSGSNIATINPLRYCGYYYDVETGLYYVSSRYYDPETCRFINADGYVITPNGDMSSLNMFSYCGNNPINRIDSSGTHWYFLWIDNLFKLGAHAPKSDVGAAKPYVPVPAGTKETDPNCYAFAVGSPTNKQPGGSSGIVPKKSNSVNDVGKSVKADLKADGYTVRTIKGPNSKVYENEFKIALRVGTKPIPYYAQFGIEAYDYHFMRQTDDGRWAEKHGIAGASVVWDMGMTPNDIPWTLNDVPYYDSKIIYYAVGIK